MKESRRNCNYTWIAGLALGCLACSLLLPGEALAQNDGYWNGTETDAFAGGAIREVYCDILDLMEGNLGGLLMSAAGILAFGAAAFGDLKHGITAVVTGVSAFSLAALMTLYFGQLCGGGGNANDGNFIGDVNPGPAAGLTRGSNLGFNTNPAQNNRSAALAIAAGRAADFSRAATLNQTTGEFLENAEGEQGFDPGFNEFGEEF